LIALPSLAERALLHQRGKYRRRPVHGKEWIVGEVVLHRPDHMGQRVEADHVRRAERRRFRAAQAIARQVVDFVKA
jgi:hypothetical protein